MQIIYLAGGNPRNKDWIEKVKSRFDDFSAGEILYYDHWKNKTGFVDFDREAKKLAELVKNRDDYFVFAKSVGTVLALKTINEGIFHPKKAIFCGLPYRLAKKEGVLIGSVLAKLAVPTIFIQNEFDPVCGHQELEQVLEKNKPTNYQLIKNPGNDTHDYEDYEQLVNLAKEFFFD